jgi:hypothetical protein
MLFEVAESRLEPDGILLDLTFIRPRCTASRAVTCAVVLVDDVFDCHASPPQTCPGQPGTTVTVLCAPLQTL